MKDAPRTRLSIILLFILCAMPAVLSLYKGHTGKFLVATSQNRGGPFERTVIYLTRQDWRGAHGVIINKPVDEKIRPLRHLLPELSWNVKIFDGGPVAFADARFVMVKDPKFPNGLAVVPIEDMRADYPGLAIDLDAHKNSERPRLFLGYAGWAPFQLNNEIARGVWAVIDFDPALMDLPPEDIWRKAAEKAAARIAVYPGRV